MSLELAHTGEGITSIVEIGLTKGRIFDYVKKHPGSYLRQIRRDLDISMGAIQHHLLSLEREDKILSRRTGLYKRFYPNLVFEENQKDILDVLSQETERDLLLYLIHNPGASQKQLAEYTKCSAGTINWHMKRLQKSGLVSLRHEGQFVKYQIGTSADEILGLVQSYHPSIWEKWSDRMANALSDVTS